MKSTTPWVPEATLFGALIPAQPRSPMDYWDRVSPHAWANVLAGFRLFSGVPKRRLRKLVAQSRLSEYGLGERVIQQGDAGDSLYVILSGFAQARGKPA